MLVDWVILPLEKEVPIVLEGYGGFKFSKHQVPSLWMSVWWWVRLVLWWHSCDLLKYLSNSREQFKGWLPLLSLCRQRFAILMLVTFRWVFAANNYVSQHLRLGHTIWGGGTARYVKLRIAILNLPPIIVCCRQLSLTNPLATADGRKSQSRRHKNCRDSFQISLENATPISLTHAAAIISCLTFPCRARSSQFRCWSLPAEWTLRRVGTPNSSHVIVAATHRQPPRRSLPQPIRCQPSDIVPCCLASSSFTPFVVALPPTFWDFHVRHLLLGLCRYYVSQPLSKSIR